MVAVRKYVESKIAHMKRCGINAGIGEKGGAQPDWAKTEAEERQKRYARVAARRKWGAEYHEDNE